MCEFLGMSANVSTDICFSFTGLIQWEVQALIKTARALHYTQAKDTVHAKILRLAFIRLSLVLYKTILLNLAS